jgi:hypothetical protein
MNARPRRVRIFLAAQHDMVGPSAATTNILWRFFVGDLLDLLAVIAACSGGQCARSTRGAGSRCRWLG